MAQGRLARIAGPQGPVISQLGYGAMGFHAFYTTTMPKQEDVEEVFNELVKTHPNPVMLDTASVYSLTPGNGDNERSIGAWLKRYPEQREKIFLASKYFFGPDGGALSTAQDAIDSCNASLERLGLSSVDLYYVHRPNREVGISGAMHGLKSLKEAGKIKYVGVSEFNLAELKEANEIVHVDAYQIEVSPWTPEIMQNGLLDWCTQNGTSVVAYSPLGRGALANRWQSYDEIPEGDWRRNNERFMGENWDKNRKLVQDIVDIGQKKGHGVTPSQVTLAWLMAISDNIFPIPGTTSMQRLRENAGAASLQLSKDEVDSITQLVNSFTVSGDRYSGAFAKLSAF